MRTIEFDAQIKNGIIRVPFLLTPDIAGKTTSAKVILVFPEKNQPSFSKYSLIKAFENACKRNIFRKIKNSVAWQKKLRNEWE